MIYTMVLWGLILVITSLDSKSNNKNNNNKKKIIVDAGIGNEFINYYYYYCNTYDTICDHQSNGGRGIGKGDIRIKNSN